MLEDLSQFLQIQQANKSSRFAQEPLQHFIILGSLDLEDSTLPSGNSHESRPQRFSINVVMRHGVRSPWHACDRSVQSWWTYHMMHWNVRIVCSWNKSLFLCMPMTNVSAHGGRALVKTNVMLKSEEWCIAKKIFLDFKETSSACCRQFEACPVIWFWRKGLANLTGSIFEENHFFRNVESMDSPIISLWKPLTARDACKFQVCRCFAIKSEMHTVQQLD